MGKPAFLDLGDIGAVATGDAVDVTHLESVDVLIGGTFVATVSLEVSFDGGATFVPHPDATDLTAPAIVPLGMRANQIRLDVTAYTSGTVLGRASGTDEDRLG